MVDAIVLYIPCGAPESVLQRGIGGFVLSAEYRYDTGNLLAGIVGLLLLGLAVSWLIGPAERLRLSSR